MNRQLRNKWTAALRSGDYKQGYGQLKESYANSPGEAAFYCCMGVLCDIVDPDSWTFADDWRIPEWIPHAYNDLDSEESTWALDTELNDTMLQELGLSIENQKHLVHMNDDQRASFETIADTIEREVPVED